MPSHTPKEKILTPFLHCPSPACLRIPLESNYTHFFLSVGGKERKSFCCMGLFRWREGGHRTVEGIGPLFLSYSSNSSKTGRFKTGGRNGLGFGSSGIPWPLTWEGTIPQRGHGLLSPVICVHKDFIMQPALEIKPWSDGVSLRIGFMNSESI